VRHPFFWPAAGLALGIASGRFLSFPVVPLLLLLFFLLPFLWFFRGKSFFLPLFLLSIWGIGVLRIQEASHLPPHHVSTFAEGDWVSLEGEVASLPELKEKGKRRIYSFLLESRNLVRDRRFFETTGKVQVFLFNPSRGAPYGNRVRIRGKLSLPKVPRNPGEFNYRKYLSEQGIFAVFEGYGPRSLKILEGRGTGPYAPTDSFLVFIQRIREGCARRFDSLFPSPINAFLKALILGLRKDLPEDFRDDFIKTATAHLIAISGMNITLAAGSLFFLALCLGLPQKGAALVGLFSTVSYVFLSGAGIPVIRAGWMAALFFTGLLLEREKDLVNSLFFALFAILVFDPQALFQVGLELSFLSVLSLILFTSRERPPWQGEWLQTGLVLLGTFPLCIVYFNVFSWISLLANLLAIPLFHLGVLGGLAALGVGSLPLIGPFLVAFTTLALKTGLGWIRFWAEKPWGYFHLNSPSWKLIALYYAALAWVVVSRRFRKIPLTPLRPLAVSLWLMTVVWFFLPPAHSSFALTVLAAGTSEILHIQFPKRNHWLVNTGRQAPSNQARWLLAPLLRQAGVNHLGGILLTDLSGRHRGGLTTLLSNFRVGTVLYPAAAKAPPDLNHDLYLPKIELHSGEQFRIQEKGGFQILDVIEGQVLLAVDYEDQKFLLLPAWRPKFLKRALPRVKELSSVQVLILPAWGEPDEALAKEMFSHLLPQWVIFPRRKPSQGPLLRYLRGEGIPFFFLSETGALRFEIRNGKVSISPFLKTGIH